MRHANALADQVDEIAVNPICDIAGRPKDQVKIFLIFLLSYPNGWLIHYVIHGTVIRHLYVTILGVLIQIYLYGLDTIHVVLMTVVAYLLMMVVPRNK